MLIYPPVRFRCSGWWQPSPIWYSTSWPSCNIRYGKHRWVLARLQPIRSSLYICSTTVRCVRCVCVCVRVLGSDGAKLQTTYCLIFTFVLIKKHWRGDREPATYLTTTTFVLLKWALGRVASPLLASVLYTILCAYTEILCKCCRPTICSFVQAMTTHANKLNECFPQIVGWHRERGVVECQ